jgi:hypothetical protein
MFQSALSVVRAAFSYNYFSIYNGIKALVFLVSCIVSSLVKFYFKTLFVDRQIIQLEGGKHFSAR